MYVLKIFTDDYALLARFCRNDVQNLHVNLVPEQFRIAPQQGHIGFVVYVTYFQNVLLFQVRNCDFFLIF